MNTENFEILCNTLLKLVITALCIVIPIIAKPLIKKLTDWVAEKIDALDDEKKTALFNKALKYLNDIIDSIVTSLEQEVASEIRKRIANGEATREDLCELKDKAIEFVQKQLDDATKTILEKKIPDLNAYISDLISKKVYEIKNFY